MYLISKHCPFQKHYYFSLKDLLLKVLLFRVSDSLCDKVSFIGFVYILKKIWKEILARLSAIYLLTQQGLN